jgi:hypothetical protein
MTAMKTCCHVEPTGALVSIAVASDLTSLTVERITGLIRDGIVATERIKTKVYVRLDDVDRAAAQLNARG